MQIIECFLQTKKGTRFSRGAIGPIPFFAPEPLNFALAFSKGFKQTR